MSVELCTVFDTWTLWILVVDDVKSTAIYESLNTKTHKNNLLQSWMTWICLICWCSFFGYLVIIGVLFATMEEANLRQVLGSSWVEDVINEKEHVTLWVVGQSGSRWWCESFKKMYMCIFCVYNYLHVIVGFGSNI